MLFFPFFQFTRSCLGGNKQLSQDVRPPLLGEEDTTLQFESRFESGNLAKVSFFILLKDDYNCARLCNPTVERATTV